MVKNLPNLAQTCSPQSSSFTFRAAECQDLRQLKATVSWRPPFCPRWRSCARQSTQEWQWKETDREQLTGGRRARGDRRREEESGQEKKEREKRFAGPHVWMQGHARSPATEGESLFMAPNYHYIRAQLFKLQLFHLLVICTRAPSAVTFPALSRP